MVSLGASSTAVRLGSNPMNRTSSVSMPAKVCGMRKLPVLSVIAP